jgi:hypothetical protein
MAQEPIRIGVIDTGYTEPAELKMEYKSIFCANHKPPDDLLIWKDKNGHGTKIVHLIASRLNSSKIPYCIYVFSLSNYDNTLKEIQKVRMDFLNLSYSGEQKYGKECQVLKLLINNGTTVIAAAGNKGMNLDINNTYPAECDSRIHVVGFLNKDKTRAKSSNYSKFIVNFFWEGEGDLFLPSFDGKLDIMNGTSQAAALHTVRLVQESVKGANR